jgi:thymidylate synthase (FAD)
MYLMKPGWKTVRMGLTPWNEVDGSDVLKVIEEVGRKCYKTEDKITDQSYLPFVALRMEQKHIALLDHLHATAEYICDRGVSHEWLRHKLTEMLPSGTVQDGYDWAPMAVCQESTRYCNYLKSGNVCFIIPPWITKLPEGQYEFDRINDYVGRYGLNRVERIWLRNKLFSEYSYMEELKEGWTPQMARGDLAISVKTEFIVTCSLTEWRHVFSQRTANAAHPQMREIMRPQLHEFRKKIPIIFDDINY